MGVLQSCLYGSSLKNHEFLFRRSVFKTELDFLQLFSCLGSITCYSVLDEKLYLHGLVKKQQEKLSSLLI